MYIYIYVRHKLGLRHDCFISAMYAPCTLIPTISPAERGGEGGRRCARKKERVRKSMRQSWRIERALTEVESFSVANTHTHSLSLSLCLSLSLSFSLSHTIHSTNRRPPARGEPRLSLPSVRFLQVTWWKFEDASSPTRTAQEASWWWVFDPGTTFWGDLYHSLESVADFWFVPQIRELGTTSAVSSRRVRHPIHSKETGSTPDSFQRAFRTVKSKYSYVGICLK